MTTKTTPARIKTNVKPEAKFYYQAEDSYGTSGPLVGPYQTKDQAVAAAQRAIMTTDMECVDIDPEDPRDSNVTIIEVWSLSKYDVESAGVKLTLRA